MGLGLYYGLGAGLKGLGDAAQGWFTNREQRLRDESTIKAQAVQAALDQAQIDDLNAMRPFKQHESEARVAESQSGVRRNDADVKRTTFQTAADKLMMEAGQTISAQDQQDAIDAGLGGLVSHGGVVQMSPEMQARIQAQKAAAAAGFANAGESNARAKYYGIEGQNAIAANRRANALQPFALTHLMAQTEHLDDPQNLALIEALARGYATAMPGSIDASTADANYRNFSAKLMQIAATHDPALKQKLIQDLASQQATAGPTAKAANPLDNLF